MSAQEESKLERIASAEKLLSSSDALLGKVRRHAGKMCAISVASSCAGAYGFVYEQSEVMRWIYAAFAGILNVGMLVGMYSCNKLLKDELRSREQVVFHLAQTKAEGTPGYWKHLSDN